MTFEKILDDLTFRNINNQEARDLIANDKEKMKQINYYINLSKITNEPLDSKQLQELQVICELLKIFDDAGIDEIIRDDQYDILQELLIDMGIPRLTGTIDVSNGSKQHHQYTNLRGTLDKVYYLSPNEKRTNKSRKYLDEWIKSTENLYYKKTGKRIDLNKEKILIQPKFDGASVIRENGDKPLWLTRGDTHNNLALDVSHIMNIFNDLYTNYDAIKFEVMCTEENKDKINEFYRHHPYHNSRQIVTSTLNSVEPDFKAEYLYPVPLRVMNKEDEIEYFPEELLEKFPTEIYTFGDRDLIRQFAYSHKYININGMRFRTDGAVLTILDRKICKILGRDNDINNFEIAYKFTEEVAYSKVKDIEFYVSKFGYITPVLVINDVIMKGNTVNHITLSNKERFDELKLQYGDDIKILYDIIPYATLDTNCKRIRNGRRIEFVKECPRCHEDLNLNKIMVRCTNPICPSRIVGRMYNYCKNLRIKNIGYQTLDILYSIGLLNKGIISLYKLKKKKELIMDIEGFGKLKTKKIVKEIENKRRLRDADFFGSIGIDNCGIKTFEDIFASIKLQDFLNMIKTKNWDLLSSRLIQINGIGDKTSEFIISYFKEIKNSKELLNLLKEVQLYESFTGDKYKGRVTFTGCRPTEEVIELLRRNNWNPANWSDKETKYLVIPNDDYESSKVTKAKNIQGIKIIALNNKDQFDVIKHEIDDLK